MNSESENIIKRVKKFIVNKRLLQKGDRVMLSLSAGKDSMALLDIMIRLKADFDIDFFIFHLNHMMRGAESDEDERFVSKTAKKNGIPACIERYDFKEKKHPGASFEEFARHKRYELLKTACAGTGCTKIATAHSRDDSIETIVMRIFRGTGVHGLCGIRAMNGNIVRPILELSSKEIYRYLEENNIPWREDSSNRDDNFLRNNVRNRLLPEVQKRFRQAGNAVISLGEAADECNSLIEDFLTDKYGELYHTESDAVIIKADRFLNDSRIFKFVVSKAVRDHFKYHISRGMLDEVYKNANISKSHMELYKSARLHFRKTSIDGENIIIISKKISGSGRPGKWEYNIDLKNNDKITLRIPELNRDLEIMIAGSDNFRNNFKTAGHVFMDISDNYDYIKIRNRREGDRIRLTGGTRKVKRLFIDLKLDKSAKDRVPFIVIGSKIAAIIPGLVNKEIHDRVSADFYVDNNTKKILAIHYS